MAGVRAFTNRRFFQVNYQRLISSIYALLLVVAVAFAGYCFWQYWELRQEYARLLQDEARMRAQLADEQQKLRDNQRQLERLRTDPVLVEMFTRRRLGYARPGELIFRFEPPENILPPPPNPPVPPASSVETQPAPRR